MHRRVLVAFAFAAVLIPGAASALVSGQASASVPVVGTVAKGSALVLRPLDPRTLQPLPGSWSQRVPRGARLIRSPLGTRAAAVWGGGAIVVDSRTGRKVASSRDGFAADALYWFGGEKRGRGGAVLLGG